MNARSENVWQEYKEWLVPRLHVGVWEFCGKQSPDRVNISMSKLGNGAVLTVCMCIAVGSSLTA